MSGSAGSYDAVVVGGGVTGTGLVRDLAMRGARCLLIEEGDLASGTTGRFHGLLHSGARYAVRDPHSAVECIAENHVLRRIAAHCVEDTGGVFCWRRGDPEDYPPRFLSGCAEAGIQVLELGQAEARRREPLLADEVERVFLVPDATIQPFELAAANARSAVEHGARLRLYARLAGVELEAGRVVAVEVEDLAGGGRERIETGLLANAAGYRAGEVAALAGVEVALAPGWGTMVVMAERLVRGVVNRCRMPGDGDIIVPVGTVCIAGTTSRTMPPGTVYRIGRDEVQGILGEGAQMVPALATQRALRAYAGARPIYAPGQDASASRGLSREHQVLDHEPEGAAGFMSIVGGKLTTYRLMAEQGADLAGRKLGLTAPCRTHEEPLPGSRAARHYRLGERYEANEEERGGADADLVCECELVTREAVERFVEDFPGVPHLDDMLRGLRLGMGPCQGAFCSLRAAGLLQARHPRPGTGALAPLAGFLEERLKGVRPVLWEDQARQFHLNEIVYREVLDLDHAPGPGG
ncbi:MAG: anaerobic glycerol-3-phosphate dehydrogenase subunit GlpA [Candidatus Dormibacterales bacterium]